MPLGLHDTSLEEVRTVLGFTPRRNELIDGLEEYVRIWDRHEFLDYLVIDGSFATSKPDPGDIDLLLVANLSADSSGTFGDLLKSYCYDRHFTQMEFGCEAFVVFGSDELQDWLDFFGHDRQGNVRGLLQMRFPL